MGAKIIAGVAVIAFIAVGLYSTGILQSILPGTYICDQFDVDLVIVSDTSNSMDDNCYCADGTPSNNGYCSTTQGYPYHPDFPCNLDSMKDASKSLISGLSQNENNNIGLVEYGSKVKSFRELGMAFPEVHIDEYEASGLTCISCGIEKAIEVIENGWMCQDGWCNNDVTVMLVLSDGEANRCHAGVECTVQEATQEAIDRAAEAYDEHGIRIYTVAYGTGADQDLMRQIANAGHGEMFVAGYDDISQIYLEIGGIVTCQNCDEDGVCDLGENCLRCPLDCIPGAGQVCCDGEIKNVECSIDAQCNDNDMCTEDKCDMDVCGGVCIYTQKPGYVYDAFRVCHPPCTDGTTWGQCSATQPGYYCQ